MTRSRGERKRRGRGMSCERLESRQLLSAAAGRALYTFEQEQSPVGLAVDPAGEVFSTFTDTGTGLPVINKYSASGQLLDSVPLSFNSDEFPSYITRVGSG